MADVARVSVSDYADVSAFLAGFPEDESGDASAWQHRMRAWWDLNPAFSEPMTRGWTLRDRGKIVGFLGAVPWRFQLGGRESTVFAGTTWRVLPAYRGFSILLKRRQMDEHAHVLHLSTTPRPEVQRILELLGYTPLREGTRREHYSTIVLNVEKLLYGKLGRVGRLSGLAKLAAPPLKALQQRRLQRPKVRAHWIVKTLAHADVTFDDLWARTRYRVPSAHVRTAETINWYCFSSVAPEKTLIGCFEGGRLAGYAVFMSAERRNLRIFECVDLWTESGPQREAIVGALIDGARRWAESRALDRIDLPHFDMSTAATFRRLKLMRVSGPRRPGFCSGPRALMDQMKPANSYIVLGEGDYGL